jgi:WXG100 family type VII secretion target
MLADASRTATEVGEGIAAELTRVMGAIEASQGGFAGAAGDAFQSTSAQLSSELRQILTALNTMANNVDSANAQFGSTDADAQNEITKVAGMYEPGNAPVADALRG